MAAPLSLAQPEVQGGARTLTDSLLRVVRGEYGKGRYWHGVRLLRDALAQEDGLDEDTRLVLAEGEAGWGNWPAVRQLLEAPLGEGDLSGSGAWYLLGRSLEASGDWEGAASAYGAAVEGSAGSSEPVPAYDAWALQGRLVRVLGRLGRFRDAEAVFRRVLPEDPSLAGWVGLEVAGMAADQGVPEATRIFLSAVPRMEVRVEGWDLPARSLLAAGDSAGAEAAFWSAIPGLENARRRGDAWAEVARLRLERGDSAGARGAYHQVLGEGLRGAEGVEAAAYLLALGIDSVQVARRGAELLAGAGRVDDALMAWDRYRELLGEEVPPDVVLSVAGLHLRRRAPGEALEVLSPLLDAEDPSIGVRSLVLQTQALRALGRAGEARRVQDTLVARFPSRPQAVEILFLRADALQDRGDLEGALAGFQATAQLSPAQNLAGQARMRMGQIHISRGQWDASARVYRDYLEDFPSGRRWDEAAFWAGRSLLEVGEEGEGRGLLESLMARFPLSYYAVQAGVILGEAYAPNLNRPSGSLDLPDPFRDGLALVDRLVDGDFGRGAQWEVDRLVALAGEEADPEARRNGRVSLALALNERGFTREGINLGWAVIRDGGEWDGDLLMAIYPFPYRELVLQNAREAGLDPFLMAGLMRQESAFWAQAVSRADARGLMQVLPTTGAELARARGPRPFDADEHLFRPEINVHLGMAFFADLRRRFGEDRSILLSAYNAGPTRARRWREFPEAGDLPRFVERVPFTETRGYVKNVLRNREIYAWLYGRRPS